MVVWLLGEGTHDEAADESGDLSILPVLGLQLQGQLVSFNQRRVFELQLSLRPFLPALPWIDHWVLVDVFVFPEEVGHVLHSDQLLQAVKEHRIIHVSVVILLCQLFVLLWGAQFFLGALVDERCYFVVAGQEGEFQSGQPMRGHELVVCTVFQQVSHYSDVIPLDSCNEWRLSIFRWLIDGSLALLEQECSGGVISIVGSTIERGHLGLLSDFVVEEVGSFLQQFADVLGVLAVNVVEEVLAIGVGHCQTLGRSHGQLITNTLQSNVSRAG